MFILFGKYRYVNNSFCLKLNVVFCSLCYSISSPKAIPVFGINHPAERRLIKCLPPLASCMYLGKRNALRVDWHSSSLALWLLGLSSGQEKLSNGRHSREDSVCPLCWEEGTSPPPSLVGGNSYGWRSRGHPGMWFTSPFVEVIVWLPFPEPTLIVKF